MGLLLIARNLEHVSVACRALKDVISFESSLLDSVDSFSRESPLGVWIDPTAIFLNSLKFHGKDNEEKSDEESLQDRVVFEDSLTLTGIWTICKLIIGESEFVSRVLQRKILLKTFFRYRQSRHFLGSDVMGGFIPIFDFSEDIIEINDTLKNLQLLYPGTIVDFAVYDPSSGVCRIESVGEKSNL